MGKRGIAIDTLIKWIIAIVVLVLVLAGIATQKEKLLSIIQKLSEILRFR